MSYLDDALKSIFKTAHPESSDEDIESQISGMKSGIGGSFESALQTIPGASSFADLVKNAPALANQVKGSSTVQDTANGASGAPLSTLVPNPGNPISGIAQGALLGGLNDLTRPSDTTPDIASLEATTPVTPPEETPGLPNLPTPSSASPSSTPEEAHAVAKDGPNPSVKDILPSTSDDAAARQEMLDAERKKHTLGMIPVAMAGMGDAIGHAATAFGTQATGSNQGKVVDELNQSTDKNKAAFEEKLKNDPNSDISHHYQKVLGLMLGKDSAGMDLSKMSASQIGSTLPEVEKFMQKQMQVEAIKSNRDIATSYRNMALSEKEDQFNQRRWERFGSAINPLTAGSRRALGIAGSNNMRADRLLATAQNKTITSQDYSNMVADLQGIYKGGVPDQVMLQHGDYPSLQRKAGQILGALSGNPKAVQTPELRQHLIELTQELKAVDNKAINDNLGINTVIFDELQKSDPDKWQKALNALEQTTTGITDQKGATTPTPTGSKPSITSFYR